MFQDPYNGAPAETEGAICIHGAREHNLKNVSLQIPRNQFVVITGVSGSGKSTLAFDLLFAEGQRRFLDAMNVYARQFVEQLSRPDVDLITGIPPTVSIEQRNSRGGGKSTVATVTEIYHFLRLLYARLGTQFCPKCQVPVASQTRDQIIQKLQSEIRHKGDLLLLAPVVRNRKGFHTDVGEWASRHGYAEVRADGKIYRTDKPLRLDRFREHDVEIVLGVLESRTVSRELIDEALRLGGGTLMTLDNHRKVSVFSTHRACSQCGESFAQLDPKNFSYNSPQGWCPTCRGFGELFDMPDTDRGARAEAIEESWFEWREGSREPCPDCGGARINPLARAVRLAAGSSRNQPTIVELGNAAVDAALKLFTSMKFHGRDALVARDILPEIRERLHFLQTVGLGYLQLDRAATTLSGGEAQRIRLAAQLGSTLTGVLYILDEPTIGLHARDNAILLRALKLLQSRGNSIVVVEHDEDTMRCADHIIDLGPGAGIHGGRVVATGTLKELQRNAASITGQCLKEIKKFPTRGERRPVKCSSAALTLSGATLHNLNNLSARFPLNRFIAVTGVSGSGKSTLIRHCLMPAMQVALKSRKAVFNGLKIEGAESFKSLHEVDQSPIGRTPRSVPATYVGVFDEIRKLLSQVPEARLRGYGPGRFSFNSAGGRCPECEGAGQIKLAMSFLPPAFVRCESCHGSRFDPETLDIRFHEKNVADMLDLSIGEALEFFAAIPRIQRPLRALCDTGLDYLKLGQPSPTLSGGEAQRLKLVTHLLSGLQTLSRIPNPELFSKTTSQTTAAKNGSLFILEEPTIGLHMADVKKLVEVIQRLVDAGHTVIVIEHNLDLVAEADWVIDLGPEGGSGGGRVVAEGTPEQIAAHRRSHTGHFLRQHLKR